MKPPWALSEYLESAYRHAQKDGDAAACMLAAVTVWPEFDRIQREDWREYQSFVREQMRTRLAAV